MNVNTNTRQSGSVTIVDLTGRVTMGSSATAFSDKIRGLAAAGHKHLVLNLAALEYIDSSGLGELVASLTAVSRLGGSMNLLSPAKRVRELLQITKVNSLFQIFDDEQSAVSAASAG